MRKDDLPVETLLEIADQLNKKGLSVTISGGEPFLSPHLLDIVQRLDKIKYLDIQTNGILLEERLDELRDVLPRRPKVSIGMPLDGGSARIHDTIRRGWNHHFDVIMSALKFLKAFKNLDAYVTTVFMKANVYDFDNILSIINDHGIGWVCGELRPSGNATFNTEQLLSREENGYWMKKLLESYNPFTFFPYELIVNPRGHGTDTMSIGCLVLRDTSFRIDPQGTCHACCFTSSKFAMLPHDSLDVVIQKRRNNPFNEWVRTQIRCNEECHACSWHDNCHGCPLFKPYPCPTRDLHAIATLLKKIDDQ